MDIKCPKCGEPIEVDYLHDVVEDLNSLGQNTSFNKVWADFRVRGCEALNEDHYESGERDPRIAALYDMLGDDVDGAASMIEDFGL